MKETQTYEQSNSKTQINIPDKFDININEKNY